jgi:tetratricopeptide (TPR) repeat protein
MKKVVLLFVAVCFTVMSFAQNQNASELVEKANAAVENKDYEKAVELYESVLATPDHGQDEANITKVINQLKPIVAKEKAKDAIGAKDYENAAQLYKTAIADFPADKSIVEQAGKNFYNAGIKSYKGKSYLEAAKCFTAAEKEFKYAKAAKYKDASLKKVAEGLAAEGKMSVEEVDVCAENKELLVKSLANAYVSEGNALYKKGAGILSAANEKVNAGSLKTDDAAYTAEFAKAKKEFAGAIVILEKALELDAQNANAKTLLDACKAVM